MDMVTKKNVGFSANDTNGQMTPDILYRKGAENAEKKI